MACHLTLGHDPSVKSNPVAYGYPMTGRGPLEMYDPEKSVFDAVLPPLLPANVVVDGETNPADSYSLLTNRASTLGHGFGAFPQGWTSSPYPGMSKTEYDYVRRRSHKFAAIQEPKVYTSSALWGSRFGTQGPWVVPGVAPASQSKFVTQEMINQAAGLDAHCSRGYVLRQ